MLVYLNPVNVLTTTTTIKHLHRATITKSDNNASGAKNANKHNAYSTAILTTTTKQATAVDQWVSDDGTGISGRGVSLVTTADCRINQTMNCTELWQRLWIYCSTKNTQINSNGNSELWQNINEYIKSGNAIASVVEMRLYVCACVWVGMLGVANVHTFPPLYRFAAAEDNGGNIHRRHNDSNNGCNDSYTTLWSHQQQWCVH